MFGRFSTSVDRAGLSGRHVGGHCLWQYLGVLPHVGGPAELSSDHLGQCLGCSVAGSCCWAPLGCRAACWDRPADSWQERSGCGHEGALSLGAAAITALTSALARPLAFGAATASRACAGGLLMPGGLQVDTWSPHFRWTLPSWFCFRNYSVLNGKGPVCPGLVQTL